jgi:hypothetical protein
VKNQHSVIVAFLFIFIYGSFTHESYAQPEFTTWGNMTGIRVDDQLMTFETSMSVVTPDWSQIWRTAKERQQTRFTREGNKKIFSYRVDSLFFTKVMEGTGLGIATVSVEFTTTADTTIGGAFFRLDLPHEYYAEGKVQLIDPAEVSLGATNPSGQQVYLRVPAGGVRFVSPLRQLEVTFSETTEVIIQAGSNQDDDIQVYLALASGYLKKGQTVNKTFTLKASGEIDRSQVTLTLYPSHTGRAFSGIGGNFRLQNPETDPPVIDYSLENLRVAWGRVEMPWRFWHPEEGVNPVEAAKNGNLHERVKAAMEMALRLDKLGMPVILSAWSGPEWAIEGPFRFRPQGGVYGNPLNTEKMDKIYASITAYILYLKENYGVEINMFSFNESDLGINIRQTAAEHVQLIKGLGAYFASKGLNTKLLLGDTADANGWPFTLAAAQDPATYPYIGAVSFHSWRGYTEENLYRWHDIANRVDRPLLVGEGSIDAGAWRYPQIFDEPTYALDEIDLYVRILAICEPLSILQWQLTADYSAMSGGGVFGNNEVPLYPTQRFWNLKQLGAVPAGLFAMPITTDKTDVTCAAQGDNEKGQYAIHLVNNGATREVVLTGLPSKVKRLRIYVTDSEQEMEEGKRVNIANGQAQFTLEGGSYTTLISD